MLIINVNELDELVNRPGIQVIKVFNRNDPVYEIDESFSVFSKLDKYRYVSFASMDITEMPNLQPAFYKLERFPAFIVYKASSPIGIYTGISTTTLKVMLERYL